MDVDRMSPAPSSVSIEQHGAAQAAVDLRELGDRGSDIRRVSEKVRRVYRDSNERRFATQGLGSWPSLADSTDDRKAREGADVRPMRRSGALYRALTSARANDQIDVRERTEFRFGTTLPYAGYHDSGTGGEKRRELVELTPAERRQVDELIEAWIARSRA
jgi:hypothetical protein